MASHYENRKDSQILSICYYVLRALYSTIGLVDKSIYYQLKSIQYLNQTENLKESYLCNLSPLKSRDHRNFELKCVLGNLYIADNKYDLALSELYEAQAIYEKHKDSISFSDACFLYLQLARTAIKLKQDSAKYYLQKAQQLIGADYTYEAHFHQTLGQYFYEQNIFDSARYYFNRCKIFRDSLRIDVQTFAGVLNPEYYLALVNIADEKYAHPSYPGSRD